MQPVRWIIAIGAAAGTALTAAPADPVSGLSGRYSSHFRNGTIDGGRYESDDVVEIVPVDPTHAYIRFSLQFFNGHSCSLYGVAQAQGAALIYREKGSDCTIRIERQGKNLHWTDSAGSCQSHCGTRGGLHDGTLLWSSRKSIRYMTRLKTSQEYRAALSEWHGR